MNGFLTEIRTFYSLKELRETVEAEIGQYRTLLEDYSQWLGTILRKPSAKNSEWTKKASELQKLMKVGGKRGTKKGEKNGEISTEWAQFKDIMLCVEDIGEAELLFEAIEELKNKLGKLEKAKTSLADLERYGLGKDLLYIVFLRDGLPERIFFKAKQGDFVDKFQFVADFSVAEQT